MCRKISYGVNLRNRKSRTHKCELRLIFYIINCWTNGSSLFWSIEKSKQPRCRSPPPKKK